MSWVRGILREKGAKAIVAGEAWPDVPFATSPNGQWRLDLVMPGRFAHVAGSIQLDRKRRGRARVVHASGEMLRLRGLADPFDGIVTNDARSVVLDSRPLGPFKGRIVVYGEGNDRIATHYLRAQVNEIHADHGAGLAFVTTCSSSSGKDGNRLFAVRVADGALLWRSKQSVWSFELDTVGRLVRVTGASSQLLAYETGKPCEEATWLRAVHRMHTASQGSSRARDANSADAAAPRVERRLRPHVAVSWERRMVAAV